MTTANKIIQVEPYVDIFEKGYDAFGQNPLTFEGSEVNRKAAIPTESGVPSNLILDGDLIVRLNMIEGYLQSDNFVADSAGWQIKDDGTVEFASGKFRGDITGASGAFSGTVSASNITAGTISSKAIALAVAAGSGDSYIAAGKTDFDNTVAGFILGLDDSDSDKAKLYIGDASTYFNWDGANLLVVGGSITGGLLQTAATGYRIVISGAANKIYLLNNDSVLASVYTDSGADLNLQTADDINFIIGATSKWFIDVTGFYPTSDKSGALGSSSKEWSSVYAQQYYTGSATGGTDTSATFVNRVAQSKSGGYVTNVEITKRRCHFTKGLFLYFDGESGWTNAE